MKRKNRYTLLSCYASAALWTVAACGEEPVNGTPPEVEISFPTPNSFTDATSVTVRGTSSDLDGIAAIRVNGTLASTTNDFADWQITVSLSPGQNRIIIESEDVVGSVDSTAAELMVHVGSQLVLQSAAAVTVDAPNNRALILDTDLDVLVAVDLTSGSLRVVSDTDGGSLGLQGPAGLALDMPNDRVIALVREALVAINLTSGERTVLSSAETGSGPVLQATQDLALDVANNRALVGDVVLDALVAVDLTSGDRIVISDAATGSGPALRFPADIVMSDASNTALVLDADLAAIVAVDLASGDRVVVSDDVTGSGVSLFGARHMVLDSDNNRALVINQRTLEESLVSVDLVSGNRVVISDAETGAGPIMRRPADMALDVAGNRVVLVHAIPAIPHAVVTIDLSSGNRTTISPTGSGPALHTPRAAAIDTRNNRALVVHDGFHRGIVFEPNALAAIDLGTSVHAALSDADTGSGSTLRSPRDMALDTANNRALIADIDGVVAIDLTSGDRTPFSDDATGSGPPLGEPTSIVMDSANNRAFVIDDRFASAAEAVVAIDLASGSRTVLSDETIGSGPALESLGFMALDSANNRLVILGYDFTWSMMAVDLASGDRAPLIDEEMGSGPALRLPQGVVLDAANNRFLTVDKALRALLAVDMTSGDRVVLSDAETGTGPSLEWPYDVQLDALNDRVFVLDRERHALFAIDLHTGERIIVAR